MVRVAKNRDFVRQPKTGAADTDKALEEIADDVNRLIRPIMRGAQTARVVTQSTDETLIFQHKLDRKYSGWLIVRSVDGTPTKFHESPSQPFPDRELRIEFSGLAGTGFELWVY